MFARSRIYTSPASVLTSQFKLTLISSVVTVQNEWCTILTTFILLVAVVITAILTKVKFDTKLTTPLASTVWAPNLKWTRNFQSANEKRFGGNSNYQPERRGPFWTVNVHNRTEVNWIFNAL